MSSKSFGEWYESQKTNPVAVSLLIHYSPYLLLIQVRIYGFRQYLK